MAVAPRLQSLAGRWQIPLLAVSVGLLVAGLLRMRPVTREITFEDIIKGVQVDLQADRVEQASQTLTSLLDKRDLQKTEQAVAHRLLAETIWQAESPRKKHDRENARRILSNFAKGEQLGTAVQGLDVLKIAQAADWLGDAEQALEGYAKALHVEKVDRPATLQRLIEMLLAAPVRDWDKIDGYIDQLLGEVKDQPDALLRAVQWKMQRLFAKDDIEGAKALLKVVGPKLDVPPWSHHLRCFESQILFREEQYEAAEARLRALQANLRRGDLLYGQAGWLLGRINYIEGRPEVAISFYEEVVRTQAGSEYWLASLIGKAEALAALQRYTASAESYKRGIETLRQYQGSLLIDEPAVRQSLHTLASVLSREKRPEEALPFAEMAAALVPAEESELLAQLIDLQAQIHVQAAAGQSSSAESSAPSGHILIPTEAASEHTAAAGHAAPASEPSASQPMLAEGLALSEGAAPPPLLSPSEHLAKAGELYARLAKLRVLQSPLSLDASWQSAHCFDQAGLVEKAIEALGTFIREHPSSEYTPEAMHRLGASLQALGRIDEAIGVYEGLMSKFERTPAAFASLVPLGRCYIALGPDRFDTAEKVMLSIVEEDPTRPPLFTPSAPEFREALMELANLYMRWDKPERAIERLEQALSLYADDPEITRMQYQLADGYRRSGMKLLADAARTKQPIQGDALRQEAYQRLARAKDLFDKVAGRLDVAAAALGATDQMYLKTSYVYRADCAFDTGQFSQAADLYGRVAWRWQNDTIALSAYVQIVRSYLAAGEPDAARSALARARWILRKIPDSQFNQPPDFRNRAYWTQMFDWVEQSGLLATAGTGAGG